MDWLEMKSVTPTAQQDKVMIALENSWSNMLPIQIKKKKECDKHVKFKTTTLPTSPPKKI